jgi:CheY-like chemotaxis protein
MDVEKKTSKLEVGHAVGHPPPAPVKTVLLVDDDFDAQLLIKLFLDCVGFVVHAFSNAEEALAKFDPKKHDLVVTDKSMPAMTGMSIFQVFGPVAVRPSL